MAREAFQHRVTTFLTCENKKTESRSLMLKTFILSRLAASLIVLVGVGLWQQNLFERPAEAEMLLKEIKCNGQNVVIHSPDHEDALIACEGAQDAIDFLASQGLDVTNDIEIEILTNLPAVVSSTAAGCYLEPQQKVLLLVYSEFRKFETWFGIPIDRSLYRSLVSHEVAHAVADSNFMIHNPSIQAKEYIAYVTQFTTMEPALREQILSQFPNEGFESDCQMNSTIYLYDCMSFGIRTYLHFLELADGRDYLHAILNGEALIE